MRAAAENTTTLAIDKKLHLKVAAKAEQYGLTRLELTNSLIAFALDNCEVEKRAPIVKLKPNPSVG